MKVFKKPSIDIHGLVHLGINTGGYFVTSVINNSLPLLLLPILTRFLSPEDYANITLFTTYLSIVTVLSGAAVNAYISNLFFDTKKEENFVFLRSITVGLSLLILSVPLIFGFSSDMTSRLKCLPIFYFSCGVILYIYCLVLLLDFKKK
jgi:O-antigen/teichoic acid export membrane protein